MIRRGAMAQKGSLQAKMQFGSCVRENAKSARTSSRFLASKRSSDLAWLPLIENLK
jgi:hypothetical protein